MSYLPTRTEDQQTKITADYLPNGMLMKAKRVQTSNLYKLLKGLSQEFGRLEGYLSSMVDGRIVTESQQFFEEWEQTVGIPDGSFPAIGTAEERRRHVVTKLSSEGISTADELEWLCWQMGFFVTVRPGHYFWDHPDPRVTLASERESRFTVVFDVEFAHSLPEVLPTRFPVPFPWVFASSNYNVLQEFMLQVIPANCNAIWITDYDHEVWLDTLGGSPIMLDTLGGSPIVEDTM